MCAALVLPRLAMHVIVTSADDQSTNQVMDWLLHFDEQVVRINPQDTLEMNNMQLLNGVADYSITVHKENGTIAQIQSSEVQSFWYRRGCFRFELPRVGALMQPTMQAKANNVLAREVRTAGDFLQLLLEQGPGFGSPRHNATNKLSNLKIAAECGLKVPDFHLIRTKKALATLLDNYNGQVLVKGIHQLAMYMEHKGVCVHNMSGLLTRDMLKKVPTTFPLSLVQQYIEKRQDLRVFYLDGRCYAAAIFSQNDPQTRIDFRNYNNDRPNRTVPFSLPRAVEQSVERFMNRVGMASGSIDILYSVDKEFVFLEVNPVGQFGMVSQPCNYQLEKRIAEYLCAS